MAIENMAAFGTSLDGADPRAADWGLCKAAYEKDSCGFGLIASLDDHASHWVLQTAISSLNRLTHRGAGGDHVVDDQHAAPHGGADQRAALAMVLRFLAIEAEGLVLARWAAMMRSALMSGLVDVVSTSTS